ncbi:MAG: type II toxin-antitoxin system VapC family toxin [Egibacteraceae bacterium]
MIALADTSLFIAREQSRPLTAPPPDEIAVSIVTVAQLRLGVLMAADPSSRATRMAMLRLAESLEPLAVDDGVADAWARLVAELRGKGARMPLNDSWVAATALAHGLPVATQDRDYDVVESLAVIRL